MTESTLPASHQPNEDPHPANCENCATPLQGHYCHRCGQSAHNPLKNFGHAVEEVFESFWHLDGRVFRTLRDLQIPGLTAKNYLAGHRVGYMPPLRLFMILTLFAFFIGKLMMHNVPTVDIEQVPALMVGESATEQAYAKKLNVARTAAEVDAALADAAAQLRAQAKPGDTRAAAALETSIADLTDVATLRKLILARGAAPGADDRAASGQRQAGEKLPTIVFGDTRGNRWDPQETPLRVSWLPDVVNRWLTTRARHAQNNLHAIVAEPALINQMVLAGIAAIPSALFLLVPVFALLLKMIYINRGVSYLEHLVVALYSHAWLMMAMIAVLLLIAIGNAIGNPWSVATRIGCSLVAAWIPIYLLLMQRRVYGGSWPTLLLRYGAIGVLYLMLVTFVAVYAVFAGISM